MRGRLMLSLSCTALLAACGLPPPDADRNAAALTQLRPARFCAPSLPYFGHYRMTGERNSGTFYLAPDGRIIMRNDGGWCEIQYRFAWEGVAMTAEMTVLEPPRHGAVVLGALGGKLRLAYQPMQGFVGADQFAVRLHAPVPETIPVRVAVQP